jgi:hypothetical protein
MIKIKYVLPRKERLLRWEALGKLYSYPDCCIKEFLLTMAYPRLARKFDGTGYVPCIECNNKTEKELLDVIKKNRKFSKPFPKDT